MYISFSTETELEIIINLHVFRNFVQKQFCISNESRYVILLEICSPVLVQMDKSVSYVMSLCLVKI